MLVDAAFRPAIVTLLGLAKPRLLSTIRLLFKSRLWLGMGEQTAEHLALRRSYTSSRLRARVPHKVIELPPWNPHPNVPRLLTIPRYSAQSLTVCCSRTLH